MTISDDLKQKYLPHKPLPSTRSLVETADEAVDIRDILKAMGGWAPDGPFGSLKIDCPWAGEHADGGRDKNCRIFGSTNIYCWAMHGYITPTKLYARWKGVSRQQAAETLLDERGLLKKKWRTRWQELMDERYQGWDSKLGSQAQMVAALHSKLADSSGYVDREFSKTVRIVWANCLSDLDYLWEQDPSIERLQQWMHKSYAALIEAAYE